MKLSIENRRQERRKNLRNLLLLGPRLNVASAVALSNQRTDAEICICSEGGAACPAGGCFATPAILQLWDNHVRVGQCGLRPSNCLFVSNHDKIFATHVPTVT